MSTLFSIEQVVPNVFHLRFADHFELVAHFLRFQEYYESPEFKGKNFDILTYVKKYAKKEGSFSYFTDWSGFNLPVSEIFKCASGVKDPNPYDRFMLAISEWCQSQSTDKAYLIGTSSERPRSIWHEIAHGLWHTNTRYQIDQKRNLDKFTRDHEKIAGKLTKWLESHYNDSVMKDEMHAYLATGLKKGIGLKVSTEVRSPFIRTFSKYAPKN